MVSRALHQTLIVMRKELKDSLRDRRALFSIAFSIVIGPVLVGFMMNRIADRQREAERVEIPVVGTTTRAGARRLVPPAVRRHRDRRASAPRAGGAPRRERRRGRDCGRLCREIPRVAARDHQGHCGYIAQFGAASHRARAAAAAAIQRRSWRAAPDFTRRESGRGHAAEARGDRESSTAQQRAAQVLGFIPMFIILAAFVGGMSIATDSTAGERERGSLEALLVNPAPRMALVAGKCIAAAIMAMTAVVLTTTLSANIPRFLPLQDMGIRFRIGPDQFIGILAALLPMCLFSASLQAAVSTLARSFKEAQSYMGVLVLLPMLPGMISAVSTLGQEPWMSLVPVLGQHVLVMGVLGGRPEEWWAFATAGLIAAAVGCPARQDHDDLFKIGKKIIFGR